jgi:hypothetical protein
MSEQRSSDERTHCWHPGVSSTTLALGPNQGTTVVQCCRCGVIGIEQWHEEARPVSGHGAHATYLAKVVDQITTTLGAETCAEYKL